MIIYTCAMCQEEFEGGSEEDALAEKNALFGNISLDDCDVVCDDCWQKVRPDQNPFHYADWIIDEGQPLGYLGQKPEKL